MGMTEGKVRWRQAENKVQLKQEKNGCEGKVYARVLDFSGDSETE